MRVGATGNRGVSDLKVSCAGLNWYRSTEDNRTISSSGYYCELKRTKRRNPARDVWKLTITCPDVYGAIIRERVPRKAPVIPTICFLISRRVVCGSTIIAAYRELEIEVDTITLNGGAGTAFESL
jgi:hypothetical protein